MTDEELIRPVWYVPAHYGILFVSTTSQELVKFRSDIFMIIVDTDYPENVTMREFLSIKSAKIEQKLDWNSRIVGTYDQMKFRMVASRLWDSGLKCINFTDNFTGNLDSKLKEPGWKNRPFDKITDYRFPEDNELSCIWCVIIVILALAWIYM